MARNTDGMGGLGRDDVLPCRQVVIILDGSTCPDVCDRYNRP
jgi:hypothetical protein